MACPSAPSVAAATISWSNATAVTYSCVSGYSMQGDATIFCTAGSWASSLPQCLIVYENHDVSNTINVYENIEASEIPQWLLYLMAGSAGMAGLSFLVGLLLCCLHLLGCYSGPVVGFGGNHVYPKKQCCNCAYCCCCCCRFCKKCCTGPDDDDDEEDDEEQIGLPMLDKKEESVDKQETDSEPGKAANPPKVNKPKQEGQPKKTKTDKGDAPVVDNKNPFPPDAASKAVELKNV